LVVFLTFFGGAWMQPTVLITGGSRGIGAATARLAAARGYAVALTYSASEGSAHDVVAAIVAAGGRAIAIAGDVAREQDVVATFERTEKELGPITALVNNAGVTGGFSKLKDVTAVAVERVLAVNVFGTIICAREAVRRMARSSGGQGGAIVNISSLIVRTGGANDWVHYTATKGAINSFTVGLAREVASEGIRVNAVSPGLIDTDLHALNGKPDRIGEIAQLVPMGRAGTPHEVAEGIVWLLSPAASYTSGAILEIGGAR
jgi:NAD(P)-dependent dehydrogenase (short-subunit alcohol dehydrogenase family)